MGLFGSSTKTTVGTSISRVIPDESLPNSVIAGMTRNLTEDGEQLIEQIMEALSGSMGTRANIMHNYGDDGYIYGRPSGSVYSSFAGKEASEAVIAEQVGGPVSLAYYRFGPLNNLHIGWKKLTEQHGYVAATNIITSLSTELKPVYLRDMRVIVTDATLEEASNGSLEQWGTPPNAGFTPEKRFQTVATGKLVGATPFMVDPAATADYILVDTVWQEAGVNKFGSFTIPLTGYDFLEDWHQAKYTTQTGQTGYWVYQQGTCNEELDQIFDQAYSESGHFFPWAYFRYNKQNTATDPSSEAYKSTRKLLKYLDMDFQQIADAIHENPDIADVEQAMLMMAVPANTTNELEQRYLFDFFSGLYEQQKAQAQESADTINQGYEIADKLGTPQNKASIIIQDARFKQALNWKNIIKRKVPGSIGPIGTYTSGANSIPSSVNVPSLGGGAVTWDTSSKRHWYQHQISQGVFEEVQIFELKLTYFIFEQYTTTGDETDEILLIPIDRSIAAAYTIADREILYSRSLHYIFNSRIVTKLKWYQTGIFRAFTLVVAIVVTVLSWGTAWQSIAAALAVGGAVAVELILIVLIQQFLKYLLVQIALKLFVKEFGAKLAFVVAMVAAVAGAYQAISAGSIASAPWAKELLAVSTGLSKAVTGQLQEDFQDLLGEQTEFEQFVKDQTKTLEETQNLLTHNEYLAPLVIFGEKPNEYYQRTVHSGNIGVIGLDAVSSYVDVALTLPKLSDTLS